MDEIVEIAEMQEIAEIIFRKLQSEIQPVPEFSSGNMTVMEAAKLMRKAPEWVKAGIINGWFPVGIAQKDGVKIKSLEQYNKSKGRVEFVIFPRKFWEITGVVWKG